MMQNNMKNKKNYEEEAARLAGVIDIALESIEKYPPNDRDPSFLVRFREVYLEARQKALNPLPQFHRLGSLKYTIEDVFIFFQEAHGPAVEYFWQRIQEENLGYVRVNRMEKVLKRKRIANQQEYDFVIDTMVPYKQQGMLTDEEFAALSQMIGVFEGKRQGK
jgi:hypothetical protein